ncbi:MAG: hypothetical protein NXI08_17360 [bacterium]|nr:hypothetical protein [bacterium]
MENSKKHKDYNQGKIYCIRNTITDDVYIGSSCQPLSKRMAEHRQNINQANTRHYKLYMKMRELGQQAFYIELIEEVKCDNIEQLRKREGELIREMATLNARIECRSVKEWRQDNKETLKDKIKQYREQNTDKIKERKQIYYENNKDRLKEKRINYYNDNKEKGRELNNQSYQRNKEKQLSRQAEPFECECGSIIKKGQKSRHLKSKKHQDFINNQ